MTGSIFPPTTAAGSRMPGSWVPCLLDENRAIVKFGMKGFEKNLPIGIKMLMQENKLDKGVSSTDIAFKLAPKINAAGRMGDASVALKLYIKDDKILLKKTIENLNNLNLESRYSPRGGSSRGSRSGKRIIPNGRIATGQSVAILFFSLASMYRASLKKAGSGLFIEKNNVFSI